LQVLLVRFAEEDDDQRLKYERGPGRAPESMKSEGVLAKPPEPLVDLARQIRISIFFVIAGPLAADRQQSYNAYGKGRSIGQERQKALHAE
jgi:hypothetical protein